jgi:hypothetical protein
VFFRAIIVLGFLFKGDNLVVEGWLLRRFFGVTWGITFELKFMAGRTKCYSMLMSV